MLTFSFKVSYTLLYVSHDSLLSVLGRYTNVKESIRRKTTPIMMTYIPEPWYDWN